MPKAGSGKVSAAAVEEANNLYPGELKLLKNLVKDKTYQIPNRPSVEMSMNGLSDKGIFMQNLTQFGKEVVAALKQQGKWGK